MKFDFIAGRLVLDFVATISERTTTKLERIPHPADLTDWIALAGVIDGTVPVTAAGLTQATELREALYRQIRAASAGHPGDATDRELVNTAAEGIPPVPRLDDAYCIRRNGDLRSFLALVARDGIDLLGGEDRELIRWCADETCTRPFIDRSRGQRRHWCGMSGCGDRAKAAAYRQRRKLAAGRKAAA